MPKSLVEKIISFSPGVSILVFLWFLATLIAGGKLVAIGIKALEVAQFPVQMFGIYGFDEGLKAFLGVAMILGFGIFYVFLFGLFLKIVKDRE